MPVLLNINIFFVIVASYTVILEVQMVPNIDRKTTIMDYFCYFWIMRKNMSVTMELRSQDMTLNNF